MTPRIYTSGFPSLPIPTTSVFTHLFGSPKGDSNTVGGYAGSAVAFIDSETGATLTRTQTKEFSLRLAYGLRKSPATTARRGDVILIYSANSLNWPVALFGSIAAGLRCTLANSSYTAKELAFQYDNSGAKFIFTSEEGVSVVLAALAELGVNKEEARKRIIVLETGLQWAGGPSVPRKSEAVGLLSMRDLLQLGALQEEEKFDGKDCYETTYMCYSSGTTGKPKGVETSHHNVLTVLRILPPVFVITHGVDRMLGLLPFFHIYGAIVLLHFSFAVGVPVIIQSGFHPEKFCASIEKYRVTVATIVPPVLVVLARHPAVDTYDVSTLNCLVSSAAPVGPAMVKRVTDRFAAKLKGKGNIAILQGYGLTETSPSTHVLPKKDGLRKLGSVGVLLPNLEARIVADSEGSVIIDAKEGERGELWIRGTNVMKGYLGNPAATKDSITPDGWFKTGDVVTRDSEGYYYVVDRRKELIKYKGFQVPPAELESVLLTHPDVADAAVIGVDSVKQATELPRAYVVPANAAKVKTPAEKAKFEHAVQKWITGQVARHKFLRGGVVVIDAVPKSAAGKILRRELRDRAKQELAGRDPGDNNVNAKL